MAPGWGFWVLSLEEWERPRRVGGVCLKAHAQGVLDEGKLWVSGGEP